MNANWRSNNPWAIDLAEARDQRLVSNVPVEPSQMTGLLVWTQTKLWEVAAPGMDVRQLVQMTGDRQQERALLCGGRKGLVFVRQDGVACNFKIVMREARGSLELLSYTLHLVAPEGHATGPLFLRWEYSPKRKPNVDALTEPLAHLHPGHDQVRLPSAVLTPKELITQFLALEIWA